LGWLIWPGGGSATSRLAGLGVAEPPPWAMGVVWPSLKAKTFFLFFFTLALGGGSATPGLMRVAWPPPIQMGVVSAIPILTLECSRSTPKGQGGGSATPKMALGVAKPPPWQPPSCGSKEVAGPLQNYIYIKEIIKIIIIKNSSHVSADVCHGNRCRACTPTSIG
jgi:hypothetical protein